MDFYSYNVSEKIIDLKVYYNSTCEPEIARAINRLIDELVKANYSDGEIELACYELCRVMHNQITIKNTFDSIKAIENEIHKEEIKNNTSQYEPIIRFDNTIIKVENTKGIFMNLWDYKKEDNNKLIYAYKVPGIRIKCEEIWNNKDKQFALKFFGENTIFDNIVSFNCKINVDTEIYEKYDWTVKDGILYVTLFEKINERPDFHRVEKSKSPYKKKDAEATPTESETE